MILRSAHSHRCRRFADCLVCGHETAAEALLDWARERWQDANPPQQTCAMVLASSQRGLKPYVGMRILGGCEDCDAYQEVHRDPTHPEIWRITVAHDDGCATYRAYLESELKQLRAAWKASKHNTQRREEIRARGDQIRQQLAKGSR